MTEQKDITGFEDVQLLVNSFYKKIREDQLLAPVFATRIPDNDWPKHLQIMYNFWATVLLGHNAYQGNPFPKHNGLAIGSHHFDRWILLFHETVDANFSGPVAASAKIKADKIRLLFESKLQLIPSPPGKFKPLI
jgi:hemoglobin